MARKRTIRKSEIRPCLADISSCLAVCDFLSTITSKECLIVYYVINPDAPVSNDVEKAAKKAAVAKVRQIAKRSKSKK